MNNLPCTMYILCCIFFFDLDVPSQLMSVNAQLIEDTSVRIAWDQPSNNPPLTSVTVTCVPSPNCRTCFPSSPCIISGLASNTTYNFTVTPNNNCGAGSASSVSATTNFTGKFTLGYYYRYVHYVSLEPTLGNLLITCL